MSMHPYVTARYDEERRREWIAQAETDRLVRAARAARPRRHPARAWLRRGWRLVARLRPAQASPRPASPAPERITEPDRELVR